MPHSRNCECVVRRVRESVARFQVLARGVVVGMAWDSRFLDMVLVPLGLLMLAVYHVHLWFKVKYQPETTVIGVNHLNRQAWVNTIMSDGLKNGVLAVQTLRNSIMASTLLASTAITLSSIIGALVSSTSGGSSKTLKNFVYGETGSITSTLKYLCLLLCFLFSFVCHVQSIRYASHASFLLSIPVGEDTAPGLTPEYVNQFIYRSQNFFSLGLRGYYFSFPLLLWIFGPIPMFVCSVVMLFLLHSLDKAKEFNLTFKILRSTENSKLGENGGSGTLHQILSV